MARDYYVRSLDSDNGETRMSAEGPSQLARDWASLGGSDRDGDYVDPIQVRDAETGEMWLFRCSVERVVASVYWVRPVGEK
jgi:hypothetical protein